jgi:hypothetical protein
MLICAAADACCRQCTAEPGHQRQRLRVRRQPRAGAAVLQLLREERRPRHRQPYAVRVLFWRRGGHVRLVLLRPGAVFATHGVVTMPQSCTSFHPAVLPPSVSSQSAQAGGYLPVAYINIDMLGTQLVPRRYTPPHVPVDRCR